MIRTGKVRIMTKAAVFEKEEAHRAMDVNRYYNADYVTFGVIRSELSVSVAYILFAVLYVAYHAEEMMTDMTLSELLDLGRLGIFIYVAVLIVFFLISVIVYSVRYSRAQKRLKVYRGYLRRLTRMYQEDSTDKEQTV